MASSPVSSPSPRASGVLFRERLTPGVGTWLLVLAAGGASYLVGAPISVAVGVTAGLAVIFVLGALLFSSSPVIEVTDGWVRVGRARIEREYVGQVQAFRGDAARMAAGPDLDGRAYMCFRPWVGPKVRLEITDPADPTPYWLASSRHPEKLVVVLTPSAEEDHQS